MFKLLLKMIWHRLNPRSAAVPILLSLGRVTRSRIAYPINHIGSISSFLKTRIFQNPTSDHIGFQSAT